MKNWLKKNMFAICTTSLAYFYVYHISSRSLFLFGEPELPLED